MTLNEMLATLDFGDVRARAMLLDELHQAGRSEEEALLNWAGHRLRWDKEFQAVVADIDQDLHTGRNNAAMARCPLCSEPFPRNSDRWCQHVVKGHFPEGWLRRGSSARYFHPAWRALPADISDVLEQLSSLPASAVLPVQMYAEPDSELAPFYPPRLRPVNYSFYFPDRLMRGEFLAAITAPDPAAYVARLVNLVHQREAAGCPFDFDPPAAADADGEAA